MDMKLGELVPQGELDAEEPELEQEARVINGKKYINTDGVIYDEDGTIIGRVNDEGEWCDEDGDEMTEFSDDE